LGFEVVDEMGIGAAKGLIRYRELNSAACNGSRLDGGAPDSTNATPLFAV
jgi:hypothetical protein